MGRQKKFNALGAYIFAGGFTIGVEKHFNVLAHLEDNNYGVATFNANRPEIPVVYPTGEWYSPGQVVTNEKVDLLYGNPPCAPWSSIGGLLTGGAQNWRTDERVDCFRRVLWLVDTLRPTVVAIESIPPLVTRGWEFVVWAIGQLLDMGYGVDIFMHDSKFWGLPQQRRRVFIVGSKVRLTWTKPALKITTMSEAIKGLKGTGATQAVDDKFLAAYHTLLPDGMGKERNLRKAYKKLHPKKETGMPRFTYDMMSMDYPVGALVGMTFLHPGEPRFLNEKELMRLNGIPDDWVWVYPGKENLQTMASLLARGVNPVIADYLAKVVKRGITRGDPTKYRVARYKYLAPSARVRDYRFQGTMEDITDQVLKEIDELEAPAEPKQPKKLVAQPKKLVEPMEVITGPPMVDGHKIITDVADVHAAFHNDDVIGVDLETTGFYPWVNDIAVVQLYGDQSGNCAVVQTPNGVVPEVIIDILESDRTLIGHNVAGFDLPFLHYAGLDIMKAKWFDTLVAETAIRATQRRDIKVSLAISVRRRLGIEIDKDIEHSNWGRQVLTNKQIIYAAGDVLHLPALMRAQIERARESRVTDGLWMEQELAPYVSWMKINGLPLRRDLLEEFIREQYEARDKAWDVLKESFGEDINMRSWQQVKRAFSNEGIDIPNTKRETLQDLVDLVGGKAGEIAQLVLDYRGPDQRIKVYSEGWVGKHIHADRVHGGFWQCAADTTRFTSSDPSLHGIPRNMRRVFGHLDGYMMVANDYSQLEVRIAAYQAKDEALLALLDEEDIHLAIASTIFKKSIGKVTFEERKLTKAIVFTLLFGGGAATIYDYARRGGGALNLTETQEVVRGFFTTFKGVKSIRDKARRMSRTPGPMHIKLPSGLKRMLVGRQKSPPHIINTMVQGAAAAGIKWAMLDAGKKGLFKYIGAQVHDELVASVPGDEAEDFANELKESMVTGMVRAADCLIVVEKKIAREWLK